MLRVKVHPNSIHICAVVVEYQTKTGRLNRGVATTWLKNKLVCDNGHRPLVPMYIRKSQFRLPFKATNPVLMVGPGTGIAPFVGFVQERGWLQEQGVLVVPGAGRGRRLWSPDPDAVHFLFVGKEVGETVMYFGCRHKDEDYLYQEELEEAQGKGVLSQLNVAFSRDQDHKVGFRPVPREDGLVSVSSCLLSS